MIDEDTGEEIYKYGLKRDYWADRENKDFEHMDDLFGEDESDEDEEAG